jgi:diguanylate cyclase
MTRRGLPLRIALALAFGLLAGGVATGLTLVIERHASRAEYRAIEARLDNAADVTTYMLDAGMYERLHNLVQLASLELLHGDARIEDNRRLLGHLKAALPDYDWLGVADASGRIVYATGTSPGAAGHLSWPAGTPPRLRVGDVIPGAAGTLPHMDVAVALGGNGGGVLGARLSWAWAREMLNAQLTPARRRAGLEFMVVNAAGTVVLSTSPRADLRLPAAAPGPPIQRLRWPDGREFFTAMRQSQGYRDQPGFGWRVIVRQPLAQAVAPLRQLQQYFAVTGAAMAAVSALLGMWLAAFLSRPITALARSAERLRHDADHARLEDGGLFRETRQLTASFAALLEQLQQHRDRLALLNTSLEQQVQDRTQALAATNRHLTATLEERIRLQLQLEELATTDSLTGLLNRRAFSERADVECRRAQRRGTALSVLMFDIDHFKQVNDSYGHEAGDLVLVRCAGICREQLRDVDVVARYGGEEFVVLLPDSDLASAQEVAERLRTAFADARIPTEKGELRFTSSFGIAAHLHGTDIGRTLRHADEALYTAKGAGRNRSITYTGHETGKGT